jgi:hypothetical protein
MQQVAGVFGDGDHPMPSAARVRSRIHAIHFACETRDDEDEPAGVSTPTSIALLPNAHLLNTPEAEEAFLAAYPLVASRSRDRPPSGVATR